MTSGEMTPEQMEQMLNGPALEPPPGHIPQLDDPPNSNYISYTVVSICFAVSTTALFARILARRKLLHICDYVALIAYAFYVVYTYFLFHITVHPGFFVHQYDLRLKHLVDYTLPIFILTHVYVCSVTLIKVAIILEWVRIFNGSARDWYFWLSHFILWTSLIWSSIALILLNVSLAPHKATWDRTVMPTAVRIDTADTNLAGATLNIIYDIMLLLLPQQKIWRLHMKRSKKISLSIIFAFGLFGIGAGAARLDATVSRKNSKDFTYAYSRLFLWTYAEVTCGLLVFCMPALPKALEKMKPGLIVSSLKFWSSASLRWLRKSRSSELPTSNTQQMSSRPSKYQNLEEPELPLVNMEYARSEDGPRNMGRYHKDDSDVEPGIIRTTDFRVTQDRPADDHAAVMYAQHPWDHEMRQSTVVGRGTAI